LSIKIFLKAAAFCLSNHPFENLNNLHKIDRQKGLLLLKEHASLKLSVCIDEIQPAPAFVTTIIYFTMSVELGFHSGQQVSGICNQRMNAKNV